MDHFSGFCFFISCRIPFASRKKKRKITNAPGPRIKTATHVEGGQTFEVLKWDVKVIKPTVVGWKRLVQSLKERGARSLSLTFSAWICRDSQFGYNHYLAILLVK